jgi:hypothetical protein
MSSREVRGGQIWISLRGLSFFFSVGYAHANIASFDKVLKPREITIDREFNDIKHRNSWVSFNISLQSALTLFFLSLKENSTSNMNS